MIEAIFGLMILAASLVSHPSAVDTKYTPAQRERMKNRISTSQLAAKADVLCMIDVYSRFFSYDELSQVAPESSQYVFELALKECKKDV